MFSTEKMDCFKVMFLLNVCMQISEGLIWSPTSITSDSCEGKNIVMAWGYTLGSGESVSLFQWKKDNGAGGTINLANVFGGSFNEIGAYSGRLTRIGDAGLSIRNATSSDEGIYYVFASLNTSITHNTTANITNVYAIPNASCIPSCDSSDTRPKCDIPEACPVKSFTQAVWNVEGVKHISQFDCRSDNYGKTYNVCAEGRAITACNMDQLLCDKRTCKGTTTTTPGTSASSSSTPTSSPTTTRSTEHATNSSTSTSTNQATSGPTASASISISTSANPATTGSIASATNNISTVTSSTANNSSTTNKSMVDGVDIKVIVPAVVVPGGLVVIGVIILVVVVCIKHRRAGKNIHEGPDDLAVQDKGNNIDGWKQSLGHGRVADELDAVYTTPEGFIIYPGSSAMSAARPNKEKKHHDLPHQYSRPYTGTYDYPTAYVPGTYMSARSSTHKDKKYHDVGHPYSRPYTGTYGYQTAYVPSTYTPARTYPNKTKNYDYESPYQTASSRLAYDQTKYYPQTGHYGQISQDVYHRGSGQYSYGQRSRSHHDHNGRQQQREYYNQYEMADYGGSRAGYRHTKQDMAFYY